MWHPLHAEYKKKGYYVCTFIIKWDFGEVRWMAAHPWGNLQESLSSAFFLPINSSSPSIEVLSTELRFVSVIGNHSDCSAPLRTLRKSKSDNAGNVLFRGDEMSGIKVVLSELGVGCWIPACWGPSCQGKCGSWLIAQAARPGKVPLQLPHNVLLGETMGVIQDIHHHAFFHNHFDYRSNKSQMRASVVAQMVKNLPATWGILGSIPGLGRPPGAEHGNPLQYSCLENPNTQRSLAGYNPWGSQRVRHDWANDYIRSDANYIEASKAYHYSLTHPTSPTQW